MYATPDLLCSAALELLGHEPFTSWASTDDKHAKTAERLWPSVRDKVLAQAAFNSCIKRAELETPSGTAPLFDWTHRFALPTDWLRTLKVGNRHSSPPYRIEAGHILINAEAVSLRYVARITDSTQYEPALTELLVQAMVARMALPVTQSGSRREDEEAILRTMLREAIAINGGEQEGEPLGYNSPLIDARFC